MQIGVFLSPTTPADWQTHSHCMHGIKSRNGASTRHTNKHRVELIYSSAPKTLHAAFPALSFLHTSRCHGLPSTFPIFKGPVLIMFVTALFGLYLRCNATGTPSFGARELILIAKLIFAILWRNLTAVFGIKQNILRDY